MPILTLKRGGKARRELDAHLLADCIERVGPSAAFVEDQWSRPNDGHGGGFAFGKNFGIVIGILATLDIPMTLVAPQRWKKVLGVLAAKDAARARASQLLPHAARHWTRVRDDGRAEAALIALYGLRTLSQ